MLAAKAGSIRLAQSCIHNRIVDPNLFNVRGETALHVAAAYDNLEICKMLVTAGSAIACSDGGGDTPLHSAVSSGSFRAAEFLIRSGAKPNATNLAGASPLHQCAALGHASCAELLINNGAIIDAETRRAQTPLHYAATAGESETLQLLLEAGAAPNMANEDGETCAHIVCRQGRDDMLHMLLASGCDPNAVNGMGESPCHLAASYGYYDCAECLSLYSLDVAIRNRKGRTAVEEATLSGHVHIVDLVESLALAQGEDEAAAVEMDEGDGDEGDGDEGDGDEGEKMSEEKEAEEAEEEEVKEEVFEGEKEAANAAAAATAALEFKVMETQAKGKILDLDAGEVLGEDVTTPLPSEGMTELGGPSLFAAQPFSDDDGIGGFGLGVDEVGHKPYKAMVEEQRKEKGESQLLSKEETATDNVTPKRGNGSRPQADKALQKVTPKVAALVREETYGTALASVLRNLRDNELAGDNAGAEDPRMHWTKLSDGENIYYYNTLTHESSWDPPNLESGSVATAASASTSSHAVFASAEEQQTLTPKLERLDSDLGEEEAQEAALAAEAVARAQENAEYEELQRSTQSERDESRVEEEDWEEEEVKKEEKEREVNKEEQKGKDGASEDSQKDVAEEVDFQRSITADELYSDLKVQLAHGSHEDAGTAERSLFNEEQLEEKHDGEVQSSDVVDNEQHDHHADAATQEERKEVNGEDSSRPVQEQQQYEEKSALSEVVEGEGGAVDETEEEQARYEQDQQYAEEQERYKQDQQYVEEQQEYGREQQEYGQELQEYEQEQQEYGQEQQEYGRDQQEDGQQQQEYGQEQQQYEQSQQYEQQEQGDQQQYGQEYQQGEQEQKLESETTWNDEEQEEIKEDGWNDSSYEQAEAAEQEEAQQGANWDQYASSGAETAGTEQSEGEGFVNKAHGEIRGETRGETLGETKGEIRGETHGEGQGEVEGQSQSHEQDANEEEQGMAWGKGEAAERDDEWTLAHDEESGYDYYVNSRTGETQWETPEGALASTPGHASEGAQAEIKTAEEDEMATSPKSPADTWAAYLSASGEEHAAASVIHKHLKAFRERKSPPPAQHKSSSGDAVAQEEEKRAGQAEETALEYDNGGGVTPLPSEGLTEGGGGPSLFLHNDAGGDEGATFEDFDLEHEGKGATPLPSVGDVIGGGGGDEGGERDRYGGAGGDRGGGEGGGGDGNGDAGNQGDGDVFAEGDEERDAALDTAVLVQQGSEISFSDAAEGEGTATESTALFEQGSTAFYDDSVVQEGSLFESETSETFQELLPPGALLSASLGHDEGDAAAAAAAAGDKARSIRGGARKVNAEDSDSLDLGSASNVLGSEGGSQAGKQGLDGGTVDSVLGSAPGPGAAEDSLRLSDDEEEEDEFGREGGLGDLDSGDEGLPLLESDVGGVGGGVGSSDDDGILGKKSKDYLPELMSIY